MKHILLSALLLAALPTAAMAETDLGSVLMDNAISYENTGAQKAEDPLLLLSWPEMRSPSATKWRSSKDCRSIWIGMRL